MTTAKKAANEQVEEIRIEYLLISAEETRKTLDATALKELAASITRNGVLEALIVRSLDAPEGWNDGPRFEIVAGQRRFEASKLAGKATCPCIVRVLSDAEAAELRIVSNLQREDLPPLEEALAFSSLLCTPGATVETVAAKLGTLPSYIGRRLKLLDSIEPVREALRAGAIEVGHALELARLGEAQQVKYLSQLNCGFVSSRPEDGDDEDDWGGDEDGDESLDQEQEETRRGQSHWEATSHSVANLRREIARTTLMVLSGAPFPLDAALPPVPCTDCPKRSGNAALLFDDCAQDTCTDRECFNAKVRVWIKAQLELADQEKRPLLMLSDGYSSGSGKPLISWDVTVITGSVVPCELQEEAIWINGKRAGHRVMICRDPKCKKHGQGRRPERTADDPKAHADRKKLLAKVNAEKAYRVALFEKIALAPIPTLYVSDLNLQVCLFAIHRAGSQYGARLAAALGWPAELFTWNGLKALEARMKSSPPPERLRVALMAARAGELSVNDYSANAKPKGLENLATLLMLDCKKIRAQSEPARIEPMSPKAAKALLAKAPAEAVAKASAKKSVKTPAKKAAKKSAAKPAAKKKAGNGAAAPRTGKARKLSTEARQRIADATKRRWAAQAKAPAIKVTPFEEDPGAGDS